MLIVLNGYYNSYIQPLFSYNMIPTIKALYAYFSHTNKTLVIGTHPSSVGRNSVLEAFHEFVLDKLYSTKYIKYLSSN